MEKMREERISNAEVRTMLFQIPSVEVFINRRTWRYIGKGVRLSDDAIQKKMLGAWIHCPKKIGRPQLSCKHHFAKTISSVLPRTNESGIFSEWFPLALDENRWEAEMERYITEMRAKEEENLEDHTDGRIPQENDSMQNLIFVTTN